MLPSMDIMLLKGVEKVIKGSTKYFVMVAKEIGTMIIARVTRTICVVIIIDVADGSEVEEVDATIDDE